MADHLRVRDVGINYNRAAVARRVLYSGPEPEDPRDLSRYRGRDFDRYTCVRRGGWLRHDAAAQLDEGEHLTLSWPAYRLSQKIVLRQTADRLVATLDYTRMAMGRSVIAITAEREVSLRAVLACLNSRLLTELYRALTGEEGRVLPQVKVGRLLALPIPALCAVPLPLGLIQEAERAISAAREDGSARLLQRAADEPVFAWTVLDRLAGLLLQAEGQDEGIDALIDQVVYRFYGLTGAEMGMISTLSAAAQKVPQSGRG
jgi:hypothetical protein